MATDGFLRSILLILRIILLFNLIVCASILIATPIIKADENSIKRTILIANCAIIPVTIITVLFNLHF